MTYTIPPLPGHRPATSWVHYTTSCNTQSSAPEEGRDQSPKHVELIGIINIPLLLNLVGVYINKQRVLNILSVCLYSCFIYPAFKEHAPYCIAIRDLSSCVIYLCDNNGEIV